MAKASLNMMTRTIALGYAQDGIFVNSVDTGWLITSKLTFRVTDERPQGRDNESFLPPLDCRDGAARVLDPVKVSVILFQIFRGVNSGHRDLGMFLKDYRPSEW